MREDSPARAALREQLRQAFPPAPTVMQVLANPPPPARLRAPEDDASPLTASDKLEKGVDRALDKLSDAMEVNPDHFITEEGRLGAWRVIVSAAEKLVQAQVRVDQNRLRRKDASNTENILERLKQIEQSLPNVPTLDLEPA